MNGRELSQYTDNTNTITYKYNLDGIRTSKIINGIETKYYLEGSSIIFENRNGTMIYYVYNGDELLGFIYNNNTYYYHKNIFGDIIGILDSNYNEIVTYEYDSWGAIKSITDTSTINIGTINPFRYRSYYYDEETSLYYLNSRYYNPEWGRFINADGYISTGQEINGTNMFCYTGNGFVNRNENGYKWSIKKAYNSVLNKAGNLSSTVKNKISNVNKKVKQIKSKTKTICKSIKNAFIFEWGTGIGTKISNGNNIDLGISTSTGSTFYKNEWHDYDRASASATMGITDKIDVGLSGEYTHYDESSIYDKYFMNPFAIIKDKNTQKDIQIGVQEKTTKALYDGQFIGVSIDLYLVVGFDVKIGFVLE